MLILTRKPGESLYIGDDVKITIVEMKGHQIRVGIDAPREMRIYREEIYLTILEENKKAAEASSGEGQLEALEGISAKWKSKGDGKSASRIAALKPASTSGSVKADSKKKDDGDHSA